MVTTKATDTEPKQYVAYGLHNLRSIPQVQEHLSEEQIEAVEVVGSVLPFKTNNYVTDDLIDWDNVPNDPMFILNFPQKEMLYPGHYVAMKAALRTGDKAHIKEVADAIRMKLNPHPAGQLEHNIPELDGTRLKGMQHKYDQTVLFFPSQGQTCHAYCTFCFRWPQFVGLSEEHKIAMSEVDLLVNYLRANPQVNDVLFTGGDPMVMSPKLLKRYIDPLLEANLPGLRTIRFGTKSLSYWPHKFVTASDADETLGVLRSITDAGKHLAVMAHFNHPAELAPPVLREAARRIRETGAVIRTQSPILRNINDDSAVWARMWRRQVNLGMVPYYMFVVRDTGAQQYFGLPLVRAWEIFQGAYQQVSGLARTVRGPSMSCDPGKIEVQGVTEINGEKVIALRMLQGRDSNWVGRPFFAELNKYAQWLDELRPAFDEEFFFSGKLQEIYA